MTGIDFFAGSGAVGHILAPLMRLGVGRWEYSCACAPLAPATQLLPSVGHGFARSRLSGMHSVR